MFKRLILAFAGLLACSIANASGTVPGFSLTPQFDLTGKVMPGCKLSIIQAGTVSTPQNPYQDSGLSILAPNPLLCDASGRIPQFFLADGLIKLRLTNSTGTQVFVGDNLLVVGPSGGGGGGGGTVDPTTILSTGDFKLNYGTGILSGFVRANGRTIGSATSGATERANSDCQALFQYLWSTDPNLIVSGGRGVSAAADWAANKTLTLPDARGTALAGLDDMGNSGRGFFAGTTFIFGNPNLLGSLLGTARRTLLPSNLPPYTPTGTVSQVTGTANLQGGSVGSSQPNVAMYGQNTSGVNVLGPLPLTLSAQTITMNAQGGTNTAFDAISPYLLMTIYLKL